MYISVELLSETIFGSGYSLPGYIDLEVVSDDLGLPYFKGKTFKGKLRQACEDMVSLIKSEDIKKEFKCAFYEMFGERDNENYSVISFSDLKISENIIPYIKYGISNSIFSKDEVYEALTSIRSFTKLKDGIAEDGSLRNFRVIDKGLRLKCDLNFSRNLNETEIQLLCCGVKAMKHLGTLENRGKGHIRASLIDQGEDICDEYINKFLERMSF